MSVCNHILKPGQLIYSFPWGYEVIFNFPPLLIWRKRCLNFLVRELLALKLKPKSILDFGCGTGVLTPIIRSLYPQSEFVGIDKSVHMINLAKKRYSGLAEFKTVDFFDYEGNHDLIIGLRSFEFLPLVKGIEHVKNLLTPGGVCIIVTPGRTPFSIVRRFFTFNFLRTDLWLYSPSDFYALLHGTEFSLRSKVISEFEGSYIISILNNDGINYYPEKKLGFV